MKQQLAHMALLMRDYDEALTFYTRTLNFTIVEDTYRPAQDKRWVVIAPPGSTGTSLLLARASTPEQEQFVGNQAGGRVFLFLQTDDFWRDYRAMVEAGVTFVRPPAEQSYGTVAVFEDLYGNRWDLVQFGLASGTVREAQPELVTSRLRLRPFEPADAREVQRLAGSAAIASSTLTIPHPYPDGAAAEWIGTHASAWTSARGAHYAVTERAGGDGLVGAVSLALEPTHACAELGYWIAEDRWGQGYAFEAAAALCAYAFEHLGVHRIQSRHFLRNPASGRVMQKLGMRHEGVLLGAVRKDDRFEDLALYAVLADDWVTPLTAPSRN